MSLWSLLLLPEACLSSGMLFLKTYGCLCWAAPQPFLPFSGLLGFHFSASSFFPCQTQVSWAERLAQHWACQSHCPTAGPQRHLFQYCQGNAKSFSETAIHIKLFIFNSIPSCIKFLFGADSLLILRMWGCPVCPPGIHRLVGKANHTCVHAGIRDRVSYGTEDRPGDKQMFPGREVAKKEGSRKHLRLSTSVEVPK